MLNYHSNCDRITDTDTKRSKRNKKNMDCLYCKRAVHWRSKWRSFLSCSTSREWDDEALKSIFWSGTDDILGQMLLLKEGHHPLTDFINYTLWVCGSSFTVGVVKEDNISSDSLEPVPLSAAISLPAPNWITHHLSPECPKTTERTSATDQTTHMPATEPEPAIMSAPKLAARFPEPEEEHWLIDLWTKEPVPTPELSPLQSVSVNYQDAPSLIPRSSCLCLHLALPQASLPPARPCETDSLQAYDATTACQPISSTLALLSLGFTVSPWAPCSSGSTLVPRSPESTTDFRACGCASALHPFDSTGLLLPSASSFVLILSAFAPVRRATGSALD